MPYSRHRGLIRFLGRKEACSRNSVNFGGKIEMNFRPNLGGYPDTDPVTQAILKFRFPTRAQLEEQTGYSDGFLAKAFWFVYASTYGLLNNERKHKPVHYSDVATTSNFRAKESGFLLKPKGMVVALGHDLEDLGEVLAGKKSPTKHLPATYVAISAAHHLLAEESGIDIKNILSILTPTGSMVYSPVQRYYDAKAETRPGEKLNVTPEDLVARLNRFYGSFHIGQAEVDSFYSRLIQRWQYVLGLLEKEPHKTYLPPSERTYIRSTINGFIENISKLKPGDRLGAGDLGNIVLDENKQVADLIPRSAEIVKIPNELTFPNESMVLVNVDQALYAKYAKSTMEATVRFAGADENPGPVKLLDARDNAARLGPRVKNMRNQTLQYSRLLDEAALATAELRGRGRQAELQYPMRFLFFTLQDAVETRRDHFGKYTEDQTQYAADHSVLVHLANTMPALGRRIGVLRPSLSSVVRKGISRLAERTNLI